jgi:hypothetical protein
MNKKRILIFLIPILWVSCKKDTIVTPPTSPGLPKEHFVKFVFINKIGFRNDSTQHGTNDTVFQGPCLDLHFYDKVANITHVDNTCYNRNYPLIEYAVTDSITFRSYKSSVDSRFAYQVELVWKYPVYPYTTKVLRYTTKGWPNGDTIKIERDTLIKLIWPTDTNSGKYIKTYQWP